MIVEEFKKAIWHSYIDFMKTNYYPFYEIIFLSTL